MRVLGIDEAGRGCVLGALVVGGFVVDDDGSAAATLQAAGAADSKTLSAKKRLAIREALAPLGTADVRQVSARAIDGGNLNALEEQVIVDLVNTWRPHRVIVDALGHPRTLPRLIERLDRALAPQTPHPEWLIEPKADRNYPVVGAASIFAKTTRDALLDELKATWGALGSGYPSDPVTRRWLAEWAATGEPWPGFVRTRWGTIAEVSQMPIFPTPTRKAPCSS